MKNHEELVHCLAKHLKLADIVVKIDIDDNKGGTKILNEFFNRYNKTV